MDLKTLITNVAYAINENSTLQAACMAAYSRNQTVFLDPVGGFPPEPDECPYFWINSPGKAGSEESPEVKYTFSVMCFLYDENTVTRTEDLDEDPLTPETPVPDDAQVASATENLITFLNHAKDIIRNTKMANGVMEYEIATDTVSMFPLITGEIAIQITERLCIGQDPLS